MSVTICLGFSDELILGHGVILGIINKIDYSKLRLVALHRLLYLRACSKFSVL